MLRFPSPLRQANSTNFVEELLVVSPSQKRRRRFWLKVDAAGTQQQLAQHDSSSAGRGAHQHRNRAAIRPN
jgi:hypothetical protein